MRVSVAYGGMRGDRNYHALSTVRKHEWGAMLVDTTIFVPTDLVEIIAHELEHVCEQMEGVDLPALSGAGASASTTSTATTKPPEPSAPARTPRANIRMARTLFNKASAPPTKGSADRHQRRSALSVDPR